MTAEHPIPMTREDIAEPTDEELAHLIETEDLPLIEEAVCSALGVDLSQGSGVSSRQEALVLSSVRRVQDEACGELDAFRALRACGRHGEFFAEIARVVAKREYERLRKARQRHPVAPLGQTEHCVIAHELARASVPEGEHERVRALIEREIEALSAEHQRAVRHLCFQARLSAVGRRRYAVDLQRALAILRERLPEVLGDDPFGERYLP